MADEMIQKIREYKPFNEQEERDREVLSRLLSGAEESGVIHVRPLSEEIFSLEILTVDGHEKRGKYVPSHLHLNLTYLLEAREGDALSMKADENSGVAWFGLEEAVKASTEPWFKERVYGKLNEKLRRWRADRKIGPEPVEK